MKRLFLAVFIALLFSGKALAFPPTPPASSGGSSVDLSEPGPIGATTPSTGAFTAVTQNGLTQYFYGQSLADDGTVTLPTITVGAYGNVAIGNDEERASFAIDTSGNVNLMSYSDNITANADTDGKFCIGTSVANPVVVKNRLGSEKTVMITIWYK